MIRSLFADLPPSPERQALWQDLLKTGKFVMKVGLIG
jgi:hypothetical protein